MSRDLEATPRVGRWVGVGVGGEEEILVLYFHGGFVKLAVVNF